jgi:signal transduction histidine kinase
MHHVRKFKQITNAMLPRKSREHGVAAHIGPMLSQFSIPRIVLLSNSLTSTHETRRALRSAGLTASLDLVTNHEEFEASFEHGSMDLIFASATGMEGVTVAEILERAEKESGSIPIVVLANDTGDEEALEKWSAGSAHVHVVRTSQLDRLPRILDQLLRGRRNQNANARLKDELDRAAEILRENQKLIIIGRLTASIAHEINNPLESITNLLYLMESDRESPEKLAGYLGLAQRELNRVVQISKQTLTFSRETSSPLRTQLSDLIEEVLMLYGRKIVDKELRVIRQYRSTDKVTVFPGELRQVLSNLIANAIEATETGGALIFRLRATRNWSDQGVHGLRLSIADSGVGMPASVRKRLGEPFFTTKGQQGTGLGLWVTRSILHRYGGELQLRSSVDPRHHGTVFSLFLPTNMRPQMVQPRGSAIPFPVGDAGERGAGGTDKEAAGALPMNEAGLGGSKQSA